LYLVLLFDLILNSSRQLLNLIVDGQYVLVVFFLLRQSFTF
jgi:hypothetical protein